ncbi:hypothetical protein H7097_02135 [Aeromicrobium sp.]|nr:hypothetical protein [Candidatus Saccharibacteria bacterium]
MAAELLTELIVNNSLKDVSEFGMRSASQVKGVAAGAGSAAIVGLGVFMKMKAGSPEGLSKNGRVRFVDPGWIGMRERNRQFYKSTPIYDPFAQISGLKSGPVPIQSLFKTDGKPIGWDKEFYDLLLPGFLISPHPWRKYKLLNTQNDNRSFNFNTQNVQVPDIKGRLFNLSGAFTWGHITGIDDNRQRKQYEYLKSSDSRPAGPVSVEQLVVNGLMAGKGTGATDVGDQIRTIIEPIIFEQLYESEEPAVEARTLFESVERMSHDRLLDLGAELREVEPIASPHIFGHLAMHATLSVEQPTYLQLAAMQGMDEGNPAGFGLAPAAHSIVE